MKKRKKLLILISTLAIGGIGYFIAQAANWGFTGFSWIGNNLQNGIEQGDPVIGMIGMKGSNYNVTISGEGDQRILVGSAWMGIGSSDDKFNDFTSQNDYPSLGWIHFNQPFDTDKLSSLIARNCFGAGDCHSARWNKKPGSTSEFEGYLSGWARMEIGPDGDTSPYPDVWVHFKSPGDPNNYTCNEGENKYYVCVDSNGRLEGYAWSAGADHVSIDGNPGLGWIKFSKQFAGLENMGEIPASSHFCTALPGENSKGVECKDSDNFTGKFNFTAYQSGFVLDYGDDRNQNFRWICDPNQTKPGETVTCEYKTEGIYTPQLQVYDTAIQRWSGEPGGPPDCVNQATVEVTTEKSCSVGMKTAATGNNEKLVKDLKIDSSDVTIEAGVDQQCLDGGKIVWTVGGRTFEDDDAITVDTSGSASIKAAAKIIKDEKTYDCGSATATVKETVKWR